jgi:hypothetical protein
MIVCPPKNADFKKLVDAVGEAKAYIAFFRAGNLIPTLEAARTHLATRPAGYTFKAPDAVPPTGQIGTSAAITAVSAPEIKPPDISQQPLEGDAARARIADLDQHLEAVQKKEDDLGPFAKNVRVSLSDERRAILEERLQRQAELGSKEAADALMRYHEAMAAHAETGPGEDALVRKWFESGEHPLITPKAAETTGHTHAAEIRRLHEDLIALKQKKAETRGFRAKPGTVKIEGVNRLIQPQEALDQYGDSLAEHLGLPPNSFTETGVLERIKKAYEAPPVVSPMPPKLELRQPVVPSVHPKAEVSRPEPFGYGAVIEGGRSVDLRNLEEASAHGPEEWHTELDTNAQQGEMIGHDGNRADTKIGVALQAPDGRVIVTGLIRPQSVPRVGKVARAIKELAFQRMGANRGGDRVVEASGSVPAHVEDVVAAGYKPIAILHFDGEPAKIHKTFENAAAFDAAWQASEKTRPPEEIAGKKVPKQFGFVEKAAKSEAEIQAQIDDIGRRYEKADADEQPIMQADLVKLYDDLHRVTSTNQVQTGNEGAAPEVPFRTLRETEHLMPSAASRAHEFGTVIGRLRSQGGKVDLFAKEFAEQSNAKIIQAQIDSLQEKLAGAKGPAKRALQEQISYREQRIKDLKEAVGVTFNPWHISVAMNNIQRADIGDLVTLLHEAAEKSSLHLNTVMRGAISRAVEDSIAELREKAAAASAETGVPLARETGALDLLSETLAQKLAAAGIPDHAGVVGQIVRWVKDLYYRVAMAAQAAFGKQPDPKMAMDWFENQMNRLVKGDYDARLGRMLDHFLIEPAVSIARRFDGAAGTPGGAVDYFDPIDASARQPSFDPDSSDALKWNIAFRTTGPNPGQELDIPDPEARGRIDTAALNHLIDFGEQLRGEIAPEMKWEDFWRVVGRGQDPKELIAEQEQRIPGAKDAKIGGEKMTKVMNDLANLKARTILEKFQLRSIRELARTTEAGEEGAGQVAELAERTNKVEGDFRNAAMHDDLLKMDMRDLVRELVNDYSRGLDTAASHGDLARAVRQSEGLLESDPIPARFQEVFKKLSDGEIPIFSYIKAISALDLDLRSMTNREVMEAIRVNAAGTPALEQLAGNRPLAIALTVLARKNATQVDQIQLGWLRNMEQFQAIHQDLQEIRDATPQKLRGLLAQSNERVKANGLRDRLKREYLDVRAKLRGAEGRLDRVQQKANLLEKAIPRLTAKVKELQIAGSGAQSEWVPRDGATWSAMSMDDKGNWGRTTRVLRFNPDGSAVDSAGIRSAIASNMEWLRQHQGDAGARLYESVKRQTTELAMLDVQRKYEAGHVWWLDRWVSPVSDLFASLGGAGARVKQQMLNFQRINYINNSDVAVDAHQWTAALRDVEEAAGIKDHGTFLTQVYNPAMYFLGTNPGLEEGPAIRKATALVRARLPAEPAANFNEKFAAFLKATKQANDRMEAIAQREGAFVKDPRLASELRRAVARGWLTGMRGMDGGVVSTIMSEMQKAGWRLEIKEEAGPGGKTTHRPVRATTFDHLTADDVSEANTEALGKALQSYFTAGIKQRWLEPFINKGGVEVLREGNEPIPQADLQSAWATSGGNVLRWIDNLAELRGIKAGEPSETDLEDELGDLADGKKEDALAAFRLSVLRQLNGLFGMESRLAYDVSQTRSMFDPMGAKPHVIMDARQNDLLPPEHIRFQTYDPTSSRMMLGQIAFHGAFGRNGERAVAAVDELKGSLALRHQEYQALKATTRAGRVAEAAARGWKYKDLEAAARKYNDALTAQQQLEGIYGVNNPAGPFNDMRTGMEVLHAMAGQIVDNPKVGLYHVISLLERPFAMHSLGPATIRASAGAMKDFLKTGMGSMLESLNMHLLHSADWAKEVGAVQGSSLRNQPWSVVLSDIGKGGRFQGSWSDKWLIRPLRMLRYLQQKGVRIGPGEGAREFPRFAPIPGLGVLNTIMQVASTANTGAQVRMMESMISKGIRYFSTHREAYEDPSFRFKPEHLAASLDKGVFDYFRNKTVEYGMGNLEDIVRGAMPAAVKGERLLNKDQVLRLSMMASNELDGATSVNTTPGVLQTNPVLRYAMPLLRWPLWKMHQAHEGMKTAEGRYTALGVARGLGTIAMWNLPLGIAFSFMMDQYDEKLLHKKSNLPPVSGMAAIPGIGTAAGVLGGKGTVPQNIVAMLERGAKAGNIYGLGADLAAQFGAPLDPGSGQRSFSLDQRVLVMSQLLNFQQAMRNLIDQGGDTTWASFGKPLVASLGGNGALQAVDLVNNALGLDNAESRLVRRINASSWLRAAADETGVELRAAGGGGEAPTQMTVWVREMQLAAMAGDRLGFLDAHRKALEAARKSVAEDPHIAAEAREHEAQSRVLNSWKARDPLDIFRFKPTPAQLAAIFSNMDPGGQADVKQALARFQQFSALITPTPFERRIEEREAALLRPPNFARKQNAGLLYSLP